MMGIVVQHEEPWLEAEAVAARADRWLLRRPVCGDCGRHIAEERCFPLDNGEVLCPACIRGRMVEIDEE